MERSDAAAVAQVLAGDQDAFRVLVERYSRNVFRVAFRMTGNSHDAEDVVQEAFLRAYRGLKQFELRANFGTWLYRVTVNCALDFRRKRERQGKEVQPGPAPEIDQTESRDVLESFPDPGPTPERLVLSGEAQSRMESALGRLSGRERAAFMLRHFEGLSIEEIGRVLGLRTSATKNTVFRAIQKLRRALEPLVDVSA